MVDNAPRLLAVALTTLLLAGCGSTDGGEGRRAADERSSDSGPAGSQDAASTAAPEEVVAVEDGTRKAAQAAIDAAEEDLLRQLTVRFALSWRAEGEELALLAGAFDLGAPAYHQKYTVPEASIESRLTEGNVWTQVSGPDVAPEIDGCWMHFTTGSGQQAQATAYPPAALMLVEPSALGFRQGSGREVVVEVMLQEAASAIMPKVANQVASDIDPEATVLAVATLRKGRYSALEFGMADVVEAFDPDQLPPVVAAAGDALDQARVRIDYSGFGDPVEVTVPDPSEVIELGDRDDLLASGASPDGHMETCDANR